MSHPMKDKSLYNFELNNMRFEVIDDEKGRAYVKYGVDLKFSWQDDNRTLKVFVEEHKE